ncbi:MAG: L-ribulose-5-phosphate 4-epimerase [Chloroflexi bacterium]|nr:L-ribulose-5-phosphate 4-epimerase [Chloroflexota bacterium]
MTQPYDRAIAQELKEKVALSCRVLYQQGLADYLGHPSARIPGTALVIIKPRHGRDIRGMQEMTSKHMLVVDLDGNVIEGDYAPPTETVLHTEVYRVRPDVSSVIHTHQTMTTAFGITGRPILPIMHNESALVERPIPILPTAMLISKPEQGAAVATALGDHRIVHLQNHGVVIAGPSIEQSTIDAIFLERLAVMNHLVAQIGEPRLVTQEEINQVKAEQQPVGGRWAYYTSLVDTNV